MIYAERIDLGRCRKCLVSITAVEGNVSARMLFYPNRRKTPSFSYGDIRRVCRICVSN